MVASLSHDDEYQDPWASAGTESDGEIDPEETNITDSMGTLQDMSPPAAMSHTGWQGGCRMYSPPAFLPSSPLGRRNVLTPTVGSSSPGYIQESPPGQGNLTSTVKSRQSTAVREEKDILDCAKDLILRYTLFHNSWPNTITLNANVRSLWAMALGGRSDLGLIKPSEETINTHSSVQSQYIYNINKHVLRLYGLTSNMMGAVRDPTTVKRRLEYLLDGDRFMCDRSGYEDLSLQFLAPQIPDTIYSKYFAGKKMLGIVDAQLGSTRIILTSKETMGEEVTWRNFEADIQTGVIEDISRAIMARVQQNHNVEKVRTE
ncbi:hypothetical protein HOY80DRAFT_1044379 [Tuber brumale]|nr:hypothetical protein HOY80DRAFT_1044379 [Tuber brumale]